MQKNENSDLSDSGDTLFPVREGRYDAQMIIQAPEVGFPRPLTTIIKRDGREVPFDKTKIARAIQRAAEAAGEEDFPRAESLASGVAIYLSKQLNGAPPTADQVNDAVERVLIELSDGETALAFARYRDKRDRIRAFRQGNLQAVLHELREAREEDGHLPEVALPLFVRTSDETLLAWDPDRIVEALVRETGIDPARARLIAIEVERQIVSAGVKTLTAPLVRELVDAKLLEHGLEEHRRRHMRLGVPLYDAEAIICRPNRFEAGIPADPQATDLELSARVKREYALTRVYGDEEADAHLRGDLHLHDLGHVDRLLGCTVPMGYLLRNGYSHRGRSAARPPRSAEALLTQAGLFSTALRAHFTGCIQWEGVCEALGPYTASLSDEGLRPLMRLLMIGLTHHPRATRSGQPVTVVSTAWDPVSDPHAARVALAILDTCREEGALAIEGEAPRIQIRLDRSSVDGVSGRDFLAHVAETVETVPGIEMVFRGAITDGSGQKDQLQEVTAGAVTLNLPRAAYRAHTEDDLFGEMTRLVRVAARAHLAKAAFIDQLCTLKTFGPYGFLVAEQRGIPLLDPTTIAYEVGITGLNECVQTLHGNELHEDPEALDLGIRITRHLAEQCAELGDELGLRLLPVARHTPDIARRFMGLDLKIHGEAARRVLKNDSITQDLEYTCGAGFAAMAPLRPFARVSREAALLAPLESGALTRLTAPDSDMAPSSMADFFLKCLHHTASRCIIFNR